jgi:hypothetical protein
MSNVIILLIQILLLTILPVKHQQNINIRPIIGRNRASTQFYSLDLILR